jgi:Protein tyrosine and serine/threonine kinase
MDDLQVFARDDSNFSSTIPQDLLPEEAPGLIDFLSVAQRRNIDFLPIAWEPALQQLGQGGSAVVSQSLINLQTSFAFKRPLRHKTYHVLMSEILVLQRKPIATHPNLPRLQGICWDRESDPSHVTSVLVFPKADFGDLHSYMNTQEGMKLSFESKLRLCIDIAKAIGTLHAHSRYLDSV